jgi:hypothetical protein
MSPDTIEGFHNYTDELLYFLRGLFAHEIIESRPIRYMNVVIWLDAEQRIHRKGHPAVEREDGSCEYWEHGIKQN